MRGSAARPLASRERETPAAPAIAFTPLRAPRDVLERIAAQPGPGPSTSAGRGDARSGLLTRERDGAHTSDQELFTARVERDGSVALRDRSNVQLGGEPGDFGITILTFDVTAAVMSAVGDDPYASRKRKFLDATRDERVRLGAAHRADQLRDVGAQVRRNLDAMWRASPDAATRRRALFALWDEAAEAGPELLQIAGARARAAVLAYIRQQLPAGSPDAYTPDELAALNRARTSRAAFAPY